ncbi:hypothetical protein PPERSA_09128 [Pseudocohnilembus persalinus]|uniref:Mannosyltransferase n=1 Tax=Pseudocohnilembus persalinus TaxID=266149 RepID=A0A0V0QWZ1_PSEPJ|nr:hypothetical protein PPERSA_09128 [Pseudocohnilembus persalinus]|eukprot:KRX06726.1 hypothetical protein PPERSA_09128 [Pseudocohnilembus persalinus]
MPLKLPYNYLYVKILIFRIFNSIVIRTYFAPDEYWQGSEISHFDVFNYGYKTWEWTIDNPIRSPLYNLPVSLAFYICKYFQIDHVFIIRLIPKLFGAVYATLFDIFSIKFFILFYSGVQKIQVRNAKKIISQIMRNTRNMNQEIDNQLKLEELNQQMNLNQPKLKKLLQLIVFIHICDWFSLFAMPRNIINAFEAMIFAINLFYWEKYNQEKQEKYHIISRFFATLNFIVRPTSIIPQIFIMSHPFFKAIFTKNRDYKKIAKILFINIFNLIIMVFSAALIDSLYYNKLVITTYNFLQFNYIQDMANLYGTQNFFWYFTQGLPYLLMGLFPFFIAGIYKLLKLKQFSYIYYLFASILFISTQSHKEDRFLLPFFPIIFAITAFGLEKIFKNKLVKSIIIITNIPLFIFMGFLHNRASIPIMEDFTQRIDIYNNLQQKNQIQLDPQQKILQQKLENLENNINLNDNNKINAYFFTECHQTPHQSFLHQQNIQLNFPDCSPQFRGKGSESEQLFENPAEFIQNVIFQQKPVFIILYSNFLEDEKVLQILSMYTEVSRRFHALFMETPKGNISDVSFVLMEKQF